MLQMCSPIYEHVFSVCFVYLHVFFKLEWTEFKPNFSRCLFKVKKSLPELSRLVLKLVLKTSIRTALFIRVWREKSA